MCFMFMPGMFIYKAKRGKLKMLAAKMERKSWREQERAGERERKVKKFNLLFARQKSLKMANLAKRRRRGERATNLSLSVAKMFVYFKAPLEMGA